MMVILSSKRTFLAILFSVTSYIILQAQPTLPVEKVYRSAREASESGHYDQALLLYQDCATRIREEIGIDYPVYRNSLLGMARCCEMTGDTVKAVTFYKKALDLIRVQNGPNSKPFSDCFSSLIKLLITRGDGRQTILALLEYLPASNVELCRFWGETLYLALKVYILASDWAMAERCVEKIREILPHFKPLRIDSFYGMALISAMKMGRFQDADLYLSEFKAISLGHEIDIMNFEAQNAQLKGDLSTAERLGSELVKLTQKESGGKSEQYALALSTYGSTLCALGKYRQAVKTLEKAVDIYKQGFIGTYEVYPYHNLSYAYAKLGNTEKAIELEEEALRIVGLYFGERHEEYASAKEVLASRKKEVGRLKEAASDYSTAIAIRREDVMKNFLLMDGNERFSYWEQSNTSFRSLYECCFDLKDGSLNASCYDAALFSKGLLLHSEIELRRFILENGDEETISLYRSILQEKSHPSVTLSPKGQSAEKRKLLENISALGDYTRALRADWKDVRDALSEKDVAIEFVNFGEKDPLIYGALVMKADSEYPAFIRLSDAASLSELIELSPNNLFSPGPLSSKLYSLVWKPLEAYLSDGCNVFFSPCGLLHQLTIESALDPNGKRMGERFHLHRVSSTREIYRKSKPVEFNAAALFGGLDYDVAPEVLFKESFSDISSAPILPSMSRGVAEALAQSGVAGNWPYLPGTRKEVDVISAMMSKRGLDVSLYNGAKGTEDALYSLSGRNPSIIHLATHGFFIPQNTPSEESFSPVFGGQLLYVQQATEDNSGLVFAGGNHARENDFHLRGIGDGILSPLEIQYLDFTGTDLVVLSACESGQGHLSGEEVFGLQRGFKQAGVRSILMTLSRVDDEATALMMTSFYSALLSGASKHDAFIQAQDKTREMFPLPQYWTPFILLDD